MSVFQIMTLRFESSGSQRKNSVELDVELEGGFFLESEEELEGYIVGKLNGDLVGDLKVISSLPLNPPNPLLPNPLLPSPLLPSPLLPSPLLPSPKLLNLSLPNPPLLNMPLPNPSLSNTPLSSPLLPNTPFSNCSPYWRK